MVGQLQPAGLPIVRAGERALLVAEDLRLEQRVGQRRAVDRLERSRCRAGSARGSSAPRLPCPTRSARGSAPRCPTWRPSGSTRRRPASSRRGRSSRGTAAPTATGPRSLTAARRSRNSSSRLADGLGVRAGAAGSGSACRAGAGRRRTPTSSPTQLSTSRRIRPNTASALRPRTPRPAGEEIAEDAGAQRRLHERAESRLQLGRHRCLAPAGHLRPCAWHVSACRSPVDLRGRTSPALLSIGGADPERQARRSASGQRIGRAGDGADGVGALKYSD